MGPRSPVGFVVGVRVDVSAGKSTQGCISRFKLGGVMTWSSGRQTRVSNPTRQCFNRAARMIVPGGKNGRS